MLKEAMFWTSLPGNSIRCMLCPHHCVLLPNHTGICRQYLHQDSRLISLSYGSAVSIAIDPIEKKPLFHVYPGKKILSIGGYGCNLSCGFCQNHTLAFGSGPVKSITPEILIQLLHEHSLSHLAFTYNEPFTNYEFMFETFQALRAERFTTVIVTNGFIEEKPLLTLLPWVNAMNIDWKGSSAFYHDICRGELETVKQTIQHAFSRCHIEISYLVIPGKNDSRIDLIQCRDFLAQLSPDIPVHLNRYFPAYHFSIPPTPLETLWEARQLFLESMRYVYIGNADIPEAQHTYCHHCHAILIKRNNYELYYTHIHQGRCMACGEKVYLLTRE